MNRDRDEAFWLAMRIVLVFVLCCVFAGWFLARQDECEKDGGVLVTDWSGYGFECVKRVK